MVRSGKSQRKTNPNHEIPDVFTVMLDDAATSPPARVDDDGRTVKRRRIRGRIVTKLVEEGPEHTQHQQKAHANYDDDDETSDLFEEPVSKRPSLIKTESEDSAESDMDWEEVNLQHHNEDNGEPDPENGETEKLDIVLEAGDDQTNQTPSGIKRKPLTSIEKRLRLEIHKMHFCCLLVHVSLRNHWCDDEFVHTKLRRILTKKTVSYLNPDEDKTQFQRSRSFMDGLEQASEAFRSKFEITSRGLSRPAWAENPEVLARLQPPKDIDLPMQKKDFRSAVQELKASRDVGAQLFCALLRSAGVDARLVCSLQLLPFGSSLPSDTMLRTKYAAYYSVEQEGKNSTPEAESKSGQEDEHHSGAKPAIRSLGGRNRFKSNNGNVSEPASTKSPTPLRPPIRESRYPVYWVEAFNEAVQKWIPVDPLVSKTIAKASKFEPPAGDRENSLAYVIAFEDDGSARDVTRRYAKAYNAKTRKDRVESTKGGDVWWKKVMRIYRRRHHLDRDQVEDAELAKKEAAEPMPRSVQDFKDHPYYALERHLRRHEVIDPKREVGKVGAGKSGGSIALEPIYRRRDVHNVQSADKWYRSMGREIKPGEQPLKRVPARRTRERSVDSNEHDEENAGTALYAIHQTTPYTAPPIMNGRIPKNVYGNLDIYVPSMVPPGGSHVDHSGAVRAAKILGIDFAEAVTGFVFRGRHGTAVTKGAVIASEYREAVEEVISAFEDERVHAETERRSHEALRMWRRLLAGLRIRERIEGYDIEGERDADQTVKDEMDKAQDEHGDEGGGFFPEHELSDTAEPIVGRNFERQIAIYTDQEEDGGSIADDVERETPDRFSDNLEDNGGGGFLVEDNCTKESDQTLQDTVEVETNDSSALLFTHIHPATATDLVGPGDLDNRMSDKPVIEAPINAPSIPQEEQQLHESSHNFSLTEPHFNSELTQEELHEARLLQQLYESERQHELSLTKEVAAAEEASTAHSNEHVNPKTTENAMITSEATAEATKTALESPAPPTANSTPEAESPKSDKGSLLSEDPEDEDAEPDWLV